MMSYRCEGCGLAQPGGTAPIRTTTEVRVLNEDCKDRREEVVKEKNFCPPCAAPWLEAAKERGRQTYASAVVAK